MANYRRVIINGGTYFFTVNLNDRKSQLLTQHIENLREAVRKVKSKYPFKIIAWVVLPEHLHCIWQLPDNDNDYNIRWRLIKTYFSKSLLNILLSDVNLSSSRTQKHEKAIWQRRYWEHLIRDENDLQQHIDYIHINPLKHGYVKAVFDWPYSTFHHYVAQNIYGNNWGYDLNIADLNSESKGS
jgi:putative transposase